MNSNLAHSANASAHSRRNVIVVKKSWILMAGIVLLALVAGGTVLYFVATRGLTPGGPNPVSQNQPPAIGSASASIVVMEFADYYCEYCKQFHDETFRALMDKYGTQIRFVYYDFPTSGGQQAAEAASCAQEQGMYWEYHNALFSDPAAYASVEQFASLAGTLALDEVKFRECVVSGKYRDAVLQDYQLGVSYGVRGTPTFVINGVMLIGAQPLAAFERVIDQQLSGG